MLRLLLIDPESPYGHKAFDQKLVRCLQQAGFTVDVAARSGMLGEIPTTYVLPEEFYPKRPGKISSRYHQVRLLRYIRTNFIQDKYQYVVFASFDEIPLYFSGIRRKLLLFAHNNIAGVDNCVKRFFLKHAARRGTLAVLHEFIKHRCDKCGIPNVVVQPVGLPLPYSLAVARRDDILRSISPQFGTGCFSSIVFAPTGAKQGDRFLEDAIREPGFRRFLQERRVLLVIKDSRLNSNCENILVLREYLSEDQYYCLLLASTCVVLSYPDSFAYRISGALYDCFSNRIPCVVSDIDGFRVYERHFGYDPYFHDLRTLQTVIDAVLSLPSETAKSPFQSLEVLNPQPESFLDSVGVSSCQGAYA